MQNRFALDVAFLPVEVGKRPRSVAIVIDVLRASSSIVTLFDRGCQSIGLAESVEAARRAAESAGSGRVVLCGEVEGLPPYGFDYGNSPSEFSTLDCRGKHFVMATTNGTGAVRASQECAVVLVGAPINANATVRQALIEMAELDEILLVCSGRTGRFVLDDAATAGLLCHMFLSEAKVRGLQVIQSNSAVAAFRLFHSFPNLLAGLKESDSARALQSVALEQDISFCAQTSMIKQVPRLQPAVADNWEEREGLYLLP